MEAQYNKQIWKDIMSTLIPRLQCIRSCHAKQWFMWT